MTEEVNHFYIRVTLTELMLLLLFLLQEVCSTLLCLLWANNAGAWTGGDRPYRGPGPWLPRAVLPLWGMFSICQLSIVSFMCLPFSAAPAHSQLLHKQVEEIKSAPSLGSPYQRDNCIIPFSPAWNSSPSPLLQSSQTYIETDLSADARRLISGAETLRARLKEK